MSVRDYQEECLRNIETEWAAGVVNQLCVAPTAAGKTVIFSNLTQRLELGPLDQILVLVHRDKLVKQNAAKIQKYNPGLSVEIEQGGDRACPTADVIVASVQSLHAKRLERFKPDLFRVVIVDEAHHVIGPTFLRVLTHFCVLKGEPNRDPQKLLLGFTATPKRGDSIGLEKVFDKIVFQRSIRDGVEAGWLAEPHAYRVNTMVDISQVKTSKGDFADGQLADTIDTYSRNRLIVEQYKALGEGLTFVVFTGSVQHSHNISDVFRSYGISCEAISGETPEEDYFVDGKKMPGRKTLYRRHDAGELLGLASCGVLVEGWDNPRCSVALMGRPHKSSLAYIQKLGRVLRPFPSPEDLAIMRAAGQEPQWIKTKAIILDFVDETGRHDVITTPTLFGLRAEFDCKGKGAVKTKKEIEDLLVKQPSLDIAGAGDIQAIKAIVEKIDLLKPKTIAPEVLQFSKFAWIKDPLSGAYRLRCQDPKRTLLIIQQDGLGNWDISSSVAGVRQKRFVIPDLKTAFARGDALVPQDGKSPLMMSTAKWRTDKPELGQITKLFYMDGHIRRSFGQPFAYYAFALKKYKAGDMEFSKGGISAKIDSVTLAKQA